MYLQVRSLQSQISIFLYLDYLIVVHYRDLPRSFGKCTDALDGPALQRHALCILRMRAFFSHVLTCNYVVTKYL